MRSEPRKQDDNAILLADVKNGGESTSSIVSYGQLLNGGLLSEMVYLARLRAV